MTWNTLFGYDFFISYAHADSRGYARALEEALGQLDYRVFRDETEMPPGETLSPAIRTGLRRSRALVVVGSPAGLASRYVRIEVEDSVKCRRPIIPIDIGGAVAATPWPGTEDLLRLSESAEPHAAGSPSDAVVAGIARSFRFRRRNTVRRRWLGGTAVAFIALLAGATWAAVSWAAAVEAKDQADRATERERISKDLQADDLRPKSGTDLSRAALLRSLLAQSRRVGYDQATAEIEQRLTRIPPESVRRELVATAPGRAYLALSRDGTLLAVASTDRIDLFDRRTNALIATHNTSEMPDREPAQVVWLVADPNRDGFLIEMEYKHFAEKQEAEDVRRNPDGRYYHRGDEIRGCEREIYALPAAGGPLLRVGMSRKLEAKISHDSGGDEHGPSWFEIEPAAADTSQTLATTPDAIQNLLKKTKPGSKTQYKLLATGEGAAVLGEYIADGKLIDGNPISHIRPIYFGPDGEHVTLAKPVSYNPGARFFFWIDQTEPFYTDVMPNFKPTAINPRQRVCLLGNSWVRWVPSPKGPKLVTTKVDLAWGSVDQVSITPDGTRIVALFRDRSIELFDPATGRVVHHFPTPVQVRVVAPTPDGREAVLLHADGRIDAWDITAFGPDGWATP